MLNNQNNQLHSPAEEINLLRKRIDSEKEKLSTNEERIKQLQQKLQVSKQRNLQKRKALAEWQERLEVERNKVISGDEESEMSEQFPSSLFSSNMPTTIASQNSSDDPAIKQLRQRFKAYKLQMLSAMLFGHDDDQSQQYYDEVDVDNMTYEQLLQLGDKIGKVSKGLDLKKMQSLKVKKYQKTSQAQHQECAICREQFLQGNQVINLHCQHSFHQDCIKGWLNIEKHCPNCKRDIHVEGGSSSKHNKEQKAEDKDVNRQKEQSKNLQ